MANPQPPARAVFPCTVAAVGDRTRAGDDDDAGTGVEGRFEGDLHVADNVDGRGKNLGQMLADDRGQFRTSSAGTSDTCVRDLRRA